MDEPQTLLPQLVVARMRGHGRRDRGEAARLHYPVPRDLTLQCHLLEGPDLVVLDVPHLARLAEVAEQKLYRLPAVPLDELKEKPRGLVHGTLQRLVLELRGAVRQGAKCGEDVAQSSKDTAAGTGAQLCWGAE